MSERRRESPLLTLEFPLRPGFLAMVQVPRDMTRAEADRLVQFVRTLPIPDKVEVGHE